MNFSLTESELAKKNQEIKEELASQPVRIQDMHHFDFKENEIMVKS